jgi:hypothetical protein
MTSTLKNSEYCNKTAEIIDGKLTFGCQKLLSKEPQSIRYLYECDYWAMDMKDACKTCPLDCVENKNKELSELKKQAEKINRISKTLGPGMNFAGIGGGDIQKISEVYSAEKADPLVKQALDIADFTSFIFNSAMNGKAVDPVFLQEYAKHAVKNIEILERKHEIREKIKKQKEEQRIKEFKKNKK